MSTETITETPDLGETPWEQLPLFDTYRIPKGEVSFSGKVELDLYLEDDRTLMEALALTKRCVVALQVDDRTVELSALVTARTWAYTESGMRAKTKIKVDARAPDETTEGE